MFATQQITSKFWPKILFPTETDELGVIKITNCPQRVYKEILASIIQRLWMYQTWFLVTTRT